MSRPSSSDKDAEEPEPPEEALRQLALALVKGQEGKNFRLTPGGLNAELERPSRQSGQGRWHLGSRLATAELLSGSSNQLAHQARPGDSELPGKPYVLGSRRPYQVLCIEKGLGAGLHNRFQKILAALGLVLISLTSCDQGVTESKQEIPLTTQSGVYMVPVTVNEVFTTPFIVDTGAAEVSISIIEAAILMKNGTLRKSDFIGQASYSLADGSVITGDRIILRQLQLGSLRITNVVASVSANPSSTLLLGQSLLRRLGSYRMDTDRMVLEVSGPIKEAKSVGEPDSPPATPERIAEPEPPAPPRPEPIVQAPPAGTPESSVSQGSSMPPGFAKPQSDPACRALEQYYELINRRDLGAAYSLRSSLSRNKTSYAEFSKVWQNNRAIGIVGTPEVRISEANLKVIPVVLSSTDVPRDPGAIAAKETLYYGLVRMTSEPDGTWAYDGTNSDFVAIWNESNERQQTKRIASTVQLFGDLSEGAILKVDHLKAGNRDIVRLTMINPGNKPAASAVTFNVEQWKLLEEKCLKSIGLVQKMKAGNFQTETLEHTSSPLVLELVYGSDHEGDSCGLRLLTPNWRTDMGRSGTNWAPFYGLVDFNQARFQQILEWVHKEVRYR